MRELLRKSFARWIGPSQEREVRRAVAEWERRKEELQARFLELARASGKPAGLRWAGCEWTGEVRLARERATGLLTALAGVVVRFEAVEEGEMEGMEAVSLPRDATAVFHSQGGWGTGGRALFNMSPDDAIERLGEQFEAVEE